MSQATQALTLKDHLSAHRLLAISALLALLAATAVVLVLTINGGSTQTSTAGGGHRERATTASVGSGAAPSATGVNSRTWPAYPVVDPSTTPAEGPTPYGGHR